MIALREQSRGVFSSFMFCQGVCRCLYQTWMFGDTPLLLRREVVRKGAHKRRLCYEEVDDCVAGDVCGL